MNLNKSIEILKEVVFSNLEENNTEVKRLFHGRGNFYEGLSFLTIDSIDKVLYVCFFERVDDEKVFLDFFDEVFEIGGFKTLVVQRRYLEKQPFEVLKGGIEKELYVLENGLKYKVSFKNRNLGLFFDMKNGRQFVQENSKDKKILNLFSYTCAFSISAIEGGALNVVNVDMSKSALSIGRQNHHLNYHDTKKVKFFPHNILKSWNKIKKEGPYDLIIIDPPSFQKGSFAATNDYVKIIKRLESFAANECIVLSCLNAPELDTKFIKDLFEENASCFKYIKRLDNLSTFPSFNEEKSLKNLIFKLEN